ncbi:competence protein ComGF [Pullulanibacillus pueri]|uniref:Competence protein ComGF n=1 Tax=Pullulanibacillus pueri TaxID=1437324 RepID=A0A8J2ZV21_9BACL|nr:ComGF family competence protein [Pullulanibacillus pueri]MBM7681555.1 competence protein ComGF [Pullulanibacillus pueri]GGH79690.1 hypothetical protein GCM10007096_14990 [Pullulanibacillus pueri]
MWGGNTLKNSQTGFTLLSVMIALAVLCFLVILLASIATVTFRQSANDEVGRKDIWLFFHQTEMELVGATHIECISNRLNFRKDNQEITLQMRGQYLQRKVNATGNEVVIKALNRFSCQKEPALVSIEVVDLKGKMYRWTVLNMIE